MNAMRKIFLMGLGVLLITLVPAQNKEQVLTVMFYNVENLFDMSETRISWIANLRRNQKKRGTWKGTRRNSMI